MCRVLINVNYYVSFVCSNHFKFLKTSKMVIDYMKTSFLCLESIALLEQTLVLNHVIKWS